MTESPASSPPRSRNAAATREAILRAACTAFSRHGYAGIGVRDIAADAGVTAMLVNRYFGSKSGLFAEVVDTVLAQQGGVLSHAAAFPQTAALLVLRAHQSPTEPDPLLLLLRSSADLEAVAIMRDAVARLMTAPLTRNLTGPDPAIRAALILSILTGVRLFRTVLADRALAATTPDDLAARLGDLIKALAD